MSRIGRMPIAIPAGVEVTLDGNTVTVKGSKGTLTQSFDSRMTITKDGDTITCSFDARGFSNHPVPDQSFSRSRGGCLYHQYRR